MITERSATTEGAYMREHTPACGRVYHLVISTICYNEHMDGTQLQLTGPLCGLSTTLMTGDTSKVACLMAGGA